MSITLDPVLQRIAEREEREKQEQLAATQEPVQPTEPVAELPQEPEVALVEQPEEQVQEQPAPAPDSRVFLDPARAYQELKRLEQENEQVRQALKTRIGREGAREWKPRLAEVEHERDQLRQEIARLKAGSLDEDELKERIYKDPEFRRQWEASQQPQAGPDPRQAAQVEAIFNEALEEAEQNLPPEIIGRYVQALQGTWYDAERDAQGRPVRALNPIEGIRKFQIDLSRAALNYAKQSAAPPPPAAPVIPPPTAAPKQEAPPAPVATAPVPNAALAASSPDLTPNSVNRAPGTMSITEYYQLNDPVKIKLFPEGLQAAIDSGKVYRD